MSTADELQARIDSIEESYEFFLAYAAQGVAGDQASKSSGQVREFLERMEQALSTLPRLFSTVVADRDVYRVSFASRRARYELRNELVDELGRDAVREFDVRSCRGVEKVL